MAFQRFIVKNSIEKVKMLSIYEHENDELEESYKRRYVNPHKNGRHLSTSQNEAIRAQIAAEPKQPSSDSGLLGESLAYYDGYIEAARAAKHADSLSNAQYLKALQMGIEAQRQKLDFIARINGFEYIKVGDENANPHRRRAKALTDDIIRLVTGKEDVSGYHLAGQPLYILWESLKPPQSYYDLSNN